MKYIVSVLLVLVTFAFTLTPAGKNSSGKFTNYYYYENAPFNLVLKTDAIFIKLNNNTSESSFNNMLSQFPELNVKNNFNLTDGEDIISVNKNLNETELKDLINNLKTRNEVNHVSPVFKMPEGYGSSEVLMGVEDAIIAQFKPSFSGNNKANKYLKDKGLAVVQEFSLSGGKTYLLKIPKGEYAIDYANELFLSGMVNYSEPVLFYTNLTQDVFTPNDTYYPQQWSHNNLGNNIPEGITGIPGCDMNTDSAWTITTGDTSVIISLVDSGIDTLHEDLVGRIIVGLSINTYSNLPYAWDDFDHGTSCAGIIAANGNNNLGVTGVAPKSKLYGVKIFNSAGSTTTTAITNGLIAAWQRGAWISSNSWGGGSPVSAADNAIVDGVTLGRNGKGVIWCVATGNGNTGTLNWPSTNPNVIAVGGISPCNQRKSNGSCDNESWWGSNYGTGLTIVSPCVKIYTTDRSGSVGYSTGNYTSNFNGTSSATPNVSGVAALILAVDPTISWDTLRQRICKTADKVGNYTYTSPGYLNIGGWNNQMGYGRINAYNVVKYTLDAQTPVELTSFSATVINKGVVLNWITATETNNRGFEIERTSDLNKTEKSWTKLDFVEGNSTSTESHSYSFSDNNSLTGKFIYRLKQIDFNGTFEYSKEIEVDISNPSGFTLNQNYPNPFNPVTHISFNLPADSKVTLKIIDILGQEVTTLLNGNLAAGKHTVEFNALNLNSGIYFYKLESQGNNNLNMSAVKKMQLIK